MAGSPQNIRQEIIALHRAIYDRQQAEIAGSVHPKHRTFAEYEDAYLKRTRRYREVIPYDEVIRLAAERDLVYVGDYHTLVQAQKAFVKLVERCMGRGRPAALALEFVVSRAQSDVDKFVAGRLSERNFLRRIDYPRHHGFAVWPNFKRIFDLAVNLGLPIIALDKADASLAARDKHAAARIAEFRGAHSDHQLFVLAGQLHLAPSHLPDEVVKACRGAKQKKPTDLIVYQNSEELYWRLTADGLEHSSDALALTQREVALMNTSPIIAQQSYLIYLHDEDPTDEILERAPERTFKKMVEILCTFLEIDLEDAAEHVSVYSLDDLSFLPMLRRSGRFSDRELDFMRGQILRSESYFIPRANLVYLGNLSVNHAAEEAAHFIRHVVTEDDGERDGLVDGFYARVLNEGLAFFASKVINHRRKATHAPQLRQMVEAWDRDERDGLDPLHVRAARAVLDHLELEKGKRVRGLREMYGEPDADFFNAVTHMLGYILGDRLYYGMVQGRTTKQEMREIFLDPMDEEGAVFHAYFYLSSVVARARIPTPV